LLHDRQIALQRYSQVCIRPSAGLERVTSQAHYRTSAGTGVRRKADIVAVDERSADKIVLCSNIVTVICPTPPGTGVM
jgi:hypothetical protein